MKLKITSAENGVLLIELLVKVMEHLVMEVQEKSTAYAYGLICGLLRKSPKPEGTPAYMEGAPQ
jgi:hypothetical protein